MIARPRLLLADEPTGNVDDKMAFRLMHLFEELNKLGTTVVIATHNRALVERLRRPSLRIENGTLAIEAAPSQAVADMADSGAGFGDRLPKRFV